MQTKPCPAAELKRGAKCVVPAHWILFAKCMQSAQCMGYSLTLPSLQAEPLVVVDVGDLKEYVGQPPYPTDKIYAEGTPAGAFVL